MSADFQVSGSNAAAPFSLKLHRGDGMTLLAMNWKDGRPPVDFVGFAIEYKEPGGDRFYALKNRLGFRSAGGKLNPATLSTRLSPIQKFRWVHFPRNAELEGQFVYKVTPVFMSSSDELSYGEAQEAAIELRRETCPGLLNIAFTRGAVASQAFVDRYQKHGDIKTLLPAKAEKGLEFKPDHPDAAEALAWMGFEARSAILEVLDQAIRNPMAQVGVVAYDLNEPEVVSRLKALGGRLRIIIDDSAAHGKANSCETRAAELLAGTAGASNVQRQHMAGLQHNKTIVVHGGGLETVVCGSTNFTWRGLYVQNNNALVLHGAAAVKAFTEAFESYWTQKPEAFRTCASARWSPLGLDGIDARVAFSPHGPKNALLGTIAKDIASAKSSLFYALAFLYQTTGPVLEAIKAVTGSTAFVYGISDREVDGLDVQKPDGTVLTAYPTALAKGVPAPFNREPTGGGGIRLHHKFVVIDFDTKNARVYLGSYNFSNPADTKNGEQLLCIRDRRVAVSYAIEAVRIIDHYHFRVLQQDAKTAKKELALAKPPRAAGEEPWWAKDYELPLKIRDRELFA